MMYFVVYGMRILGIFPVEKDAINYIEDIHKYDTEEFGYGKWTRIRFPKKEALQVMPMKVKRTEFLHDLLPSSGYYPLDTPSFSCLISTLVKQRRAAFRLKQTWHPRHTY
jgi:hypothetical protein